MMSIKKSIIVLTLCFSAMMGLGLYFFCSSVYKASGFTSFVAIEHRWAEAEKEIVNSLVQYSLSNNVNDYNNYLHSQKLILGLRQARVELEKENPDLTAVEKLFYSSPEVFELLRMANHITGYSQKGNLQKVFEKWDLGDGKLILLEDVASELHQDIQKNEFADKKEYYLARIARTNEDFSLTEKEFLTATLEAQRSFYQSVLWFGSFIFSVMIIFGAAIAFFLTRQGLKNLKSVTELVGRLRAGDFEGTIEDATDETKDFVAAFKSLSEDLRMAAHNQQTALLLGGLGTWQWIPHEHKMIWSKKMFEFLNIPGNHPASYEGFRSRIHPDDRGIFDNILKKESFAEVSVLPVEIRFVIHHGESWQVHRFNFLVESHQKQGKIIISGTVKESTAKSSASKAS
jgi:HAMP domain-containing protein